MHTESGRHSPSSDAQRFGRWLAAELERQGSSAPKLAAALGVYRPTVYRWLNGKFRPEAATCKAIAEALGVEHDLVLAMAGYRTYQLAVAGAVRRQIMELASEIPEELLLPLIPMLRGLADEATQAELREALTARLGGDRHE